MQLGFFKGDIDNVGDDLNPYLWPKLIQNIDKFQKDGVFIGIGSILDSRYDDYPYKMVFGSGARSPETLPSNDHSWEYRFVRGPNTQKALEEKGVKTKYITDPAILINKFYSKSQYSQNRIGLIPYFRTDHTPWAKIAKNLDYEFISPTLPVERFVESLLNCKLVLTEAMHGAIIADALRVPWIPYTSFTIYKEQKTHSFKWSDWAKSMNMDIQIDTLPRFWEVEKKGLYKIKGVFKESYCQHLIKKKVKQGEYYLSNNEIWNQKTEEIIDEIDELNRMINK